MPDVPPPNESTDEEAATTESRPASLKDHAGFVYLVSKGLVRDQGMRRNAMMWLVMSAVVILFIGAVFIDAYLRQHPLIFAIYWLACAWLTMSAVLLALFDILLQYAKGRAFRQAMTKELLMKELERIERERAAARGE